VFVKIMLVVACELVTTKAWGRTGFRGGCGPGPSSFAVLVMSPVWECPPGSVLSKGGRRRLGWFRGSKTGVFVGGIALFALRSKAGGKAGARAASSWAGGRGTNRFVGTSVLSAS